MPLVTESIIIDGIEEIYAQDPAKAEETRTLVYRIDPVRKMVAFFPFEKTLKVSPINFEGFSSIPPELTKDGRIRIPGVEYFLAKYMEQAGVTSLTIGRQAKKSLARQDNGYHLTLPYRQFQKIAQQFKDVFINTRVERQNISDSIMEDLLPGKDGALHNPSLKNRLLKMIRPIHRGAAIFHLPKKKYNIVVRLAHWIMAIFIIILTCGGAYSKHMGPGYPLVKYIPPFHRTIGTALIIVLAIRILARIVTPPADATEKLPKIIRFFAFSNYAFLYVLMLLIPLSGYFIADARDKGVKFYFFQAPRLFTDESGAAAWGLSTHYLFAYLTISLVALHIGAVIFHKIVDKVDLLYVMTVQLLLKSRFNQKAGIKENTEDKVMSAFLKRQQARDARRLNAET